MPDLYRAPTLALLLILAAVFLFLYARSRTPRLLLWLLGWMMASARMALELFPVDSGNRSIVYALSNVAMLLAALMFLGSLSTLSFGKLRRIPYVVAFALPLILYCLLTAIPGRSPWLRGSMLLCAAAGVGMAIDWSRQRYFLARWIPLGLSILLGSAALWLTWKEQYDEVIYLAQAGMNLITALLFLVSYHRVTPGRVFTFLGFLLWSFPLPLMLVFRNHAATFTLVGRGASLLKVVTAVGMIVLVLEEELAANQAAKERDRRARHELERYTELDLPATAIQDAPQNYDGLCATVAEASRFSQVLLLQRSLGQNFQVAGSAGMDGALVSALGALGNRTTPEALEDYRKDARAVMELNHSLMVDLRRLFVPGDELERLKFSQAYMLPIHNRAKLLDGVLLLSGVKGRNEPLRTDDLLPLELLASRIASARESNVLIRRVIRSEKLAGLGQLAGGMAHELNNPLTVVMGYAELLEDDSSDQQTRKSAAIIRSEAKRMRQIIESLARFWRPAPQQHQQIAVDVLLRDVERLRRPEFTRDGIDFQLQIDEPLPRIQGNSDQVRQVILMVLNNAVEAVHTAPPERERQIRVTASQVHDRVQITVCDSGRGFADPNRAFDPFFTSKAPGEGPGLGLSICYAIIREHHGEITAFNLQPHGAGLSIEMPCGQAEGEISSVVGRMAVS